LCSRLLYDGIAEVRLDRLCSQIDLVQQQVRLVNSSVRTISFSTSIRQMTPLSSERQGHRPRRPRSVKDNGELFANRTVPLIAHQRLPAWNVAIASSTRKMAA